MTSVSPVPASGPSAIEDDETRDAGAPSLGAGPACHLLRAGRDPIEPLAAPTTPLADDAPFAPGRHVPPGRFVAEPAARHLWLPNTADVEALWPGLVACRGEAAGAIAGLDAVALDFPAYADGRAYSQARVLRRLGFTGEVRATGLAVTRDQVHFMRRCGIDAFEVRSDEDARACREALGQFPDPYQAAADGAVPVWVRRRASGGA